jgi:integrase
VQSGFDIPATVNNSEYQPTRGLSARLRRRHGELERKLNAGETPVVSPDQKRTVADEIETHLNVKRISGKFSKATERKLIYHLGLFEKFLSNRSKFFPGDITVEDVRDFRSSWKWQSRVTQQKAQQNIRGFLRRCFKADQNKLGLLLGELGPIHLSAEDEERLEPQPFTDEEIQRLFAQIPKTFENLKAERIAALIHCQLSTGLAIRDAIQLERKSIQSGWLEIKRQKTRKRVSQKLNDALYQELLKVTNGNPRYVFWNGTSLPESATGLWQADLRRLMRDAGVWIKGNLSHRFRDTAVDTWLNKLGWGMEDVARALGDTIAIVERHYASLNKRAKERLAKLPTYSWGEISGAVGVSAGGKQ